jgi:hypothetical protein
LSLGQGAWTVPAVPAVTEGIARVRALVERGGGEIAVLAATGQAERDTARLEVWYTAERAEEWEEFLADCGTFDAAIDREVARATFTLAELAEQEQSLERLRRWYRELKARDVFGAPRAAEAEQRLKHCAEHLADYTDQVFTALHQM